MVKAEDLERVMKGVNNLKKTYDHRTNSQRKAYNSQLSDIEERSRELNKDLKYC